jgi:hypothetical protein
MTDNQKARFPFLSEANPKAKAKATPNDEDQQ